jgi:hypothetical protein
MATAAKSLCSQPMSCCSDGARMRVQGGGSRPVQSVLKRFVREAEVCIMQMHLGGMELR